MNLYSCTNLTKKYSRGNFNLGPVSIELRTGEITGVVGENGNGKTTLLRIVAGDLAADSGTMSYFGNNDIHVLTWENIRARIAYIPQRIPKWFGMLRNNLIFQCSIRGIRGAEADKRVDELLEKLGLTEYAQLKWDEISTGYRLRFQLAKMLLIEPELLVLDEPIANLDINAQGKFLADLREIVNEKKRKVSVILSSQQLHEIENVADRIIFLRKGSLVYAGEVGKIGETRTENEFEIQCSLDHSALLQLFDGAKLHAHGKTSHLKVPLEISSELFLNKIISAGGKVHYFRDISSSTRRLFND